ncbi:MAG: carboxypeptidase-like regulatory domain-containing protein [Acidobacteriota bacterium]
MRPLVLAFLFLSALFPTSRLAADAAAPGSSEGNLDLQQAVAREVDSAHRELREVAHRMASRAGEASPPGLSRLGERLRELRRLTLQLSAEARGLENKCRALIRLVESLERGSVPASLVPAEPLLADSRTAAECSSAPTLEPGDRVGSGLHDRVGWVRFVAPRDGLFAADTFGSWGDAAIAVFGSCASAKPLAEADDTQGLQAQVAFEAAAGESRWIRVEASGPPSVGVGVASTVTGRVTDLDGAPVPGIRVRLDEVNGLAFFGAFTGEDGTFTIPVTRAGGYLAYTDFFSPPVPFLNAAFPDAVCSGPCPEEATPFSVPADSTVEDIDFVLRRGARITGRVRADGVPLRGARVSLFDQDGFSKTEVLADDAGRYVIGGLLPGGYRLSADDPETTGEVWPGVPCTPACDPLAGDVLSLELEEVASGIDFALERKGSISVQLTDSLTGARLTFGRLSVFNASGFGVDSASGLTPTVGGLEAGTYFVDVESFGYSRQLWQGVDCFFGCDPLTGTPLVVAEGEAVELIVPMNPLGSLSGRVTADGSDASVANARVSFQTPAGSILSLNTFVDGGWLRGNLPAGPYRLIFGAEGFVEEAWDDQPCPADGCTVEGDVIDLGPGEVLTGFDAALAVAGSISGTVSESSGAPARSPAAVRLHLPSGEIFRETLTGPSDSTFEFGDLAPGPYFVTTLSDAYRDELWDDLPCEDPEACDVTAGTPAVVTGGAVTAVDFVLERVPTLFGRVTALETGEGLGTGRVVLYSPEGNFVASALTDAQGFYEFSRLEPGLYRALASGPDSRIPVLSGGETCTLGVPAGCSTTDGEIFEMPSDSSLTLDFALPQGGEIVGRVSLADDSGTFLLSQVSLFSAEGAFLGVDSSTGASFRFQGLETGTYFAVADFGSPFILEIWQGVECPDVAGDCDPTTGTPILVQRGSINTEVEFTARARGSIFGTVSSRLTGEPLDRSAVQLFDSEGVIQRLVPVGVIGDFRFTGLLPGTYYLGTASTDGYLDQILGGEVCEPGPCDATTGLAIQVADETVSGPFEIDLEPGPGFAVEIRSRAGQPIAGATLDLWRGSGDYLRPIAADARGRAEIPLEGGPYRLSTDNGQGLIDQVWPEVPCPDGPAFLDLCDLLAGDVLQLSEGQPLTEIVFELEDPSILFFDTFESGGLEAWSSVTGSGL